MTYLGRSMEWGVDVGMAQADWITAVIPGVLAVLTGLAVMVLCIYLARPH